MTLRVGILIVGIAVLSALLGLLTNYTRRPDMLTARRLTAAFVVVLVLLGVAELELAKPSGSNARKMVGGCAPFSLYAQNEFEPYGTATRASPTPTGDKLGGFAANELIPVDGWVISQPAYPTN